MKITETATRYRWSTIRWDYYSLTLAQRPVAEKNADQIRAAILEAYRRRRVTGSSAAVGLTGRIKLPHALGEAMAADVDAIFSRFVGGVE